MISQKDFGKQFVYFWRYENHILKTKADSNTGFVFSPLNEAFASQIKEMSITNSIYKAD